MGASHAKTITADQVTLPKDAGWRKLPIIGIVLAVIGLGGAFALKGEHGEDGLYAYLIAFMYFLSIALGGLFFSIIQYVVRGGWGIVNRRITETMAATLPLFAVLFVPLWVGRKYVWTWMKPESLIGDPILQSKAPYLNESFFLIRAVIYFVIVGAIGVFLYTSSRRQDALKDREANHAITRRLQMLAPVFLGLTALVTTFMSIDWIMSLDYHWFSTMFGIIYFAGGFMGCHAVLAVVAISLDNGKYLGGAITTEHRHAIGKMMWGLMVFWAYVSFCQFMLIWYGNIPEETLWYAHRWEHGWSVWTFVLLIGHFILPFFAMMSRHVKRNPKLLLLGALYLLAMHYVDMFWQIKPNMHHGHASPALGPVEILAFVGVGGVVLAAYTALLSRAPLVPVGDPRLPESLAFEEQ